MKHKKYHLVYFFSLLFFILALTNTSSAQSSYLDSLDGKFALQFQISHNFNLEDFQGATFSGKYHIGKREALRLGISSTTSIWNGEGKDEFFDPDTTTIEKREGNSFNIDLKFQYLRYLVSNDEISFFCGTGPTIYFENRETIEDGRSNGRDYLGIGVNIIAGVEWMFNRNMSLSAEYGIRFIYTTYEETTTYSDYISTNSSDYFLISADDINFGISVYF